jgi:sigma-B regulation protein RsbU (phosphoserine phosphatase)
VAAVASAGPLLGVLEGVAYSDVDLPLFAEDLLLLYTDGVPEGRSGREFYGEPRLIEMLGMDHRSAEAVTSAVLGDVLDFQAGLTRDDIAMVAVRVPPA